MNGVNEPHLLDLKLAEPGATLHPLFSNRSEALLKRSHEGDREAFRLLYERHSIRLYSIALRITRNRYLASDAVQEAFLQIWQNCASFNEELGTAEGWMVQITRYRAIDAMGRCPPISPADRDVSETPSDLSPLDQLVNGQALRACLERLSENSRRMIILAFVDGLSHPELASHLILPLGTVKSTLRRSLALMKSFLVEKTSDTIGNPAPAM